MATRKLNVRYVKFTPEEMAYEPPAEIDFSKAFTIRGYENFRRFREWKRLMVRLDPDVRKAFPTTDAVNDALRTLLKKKSNGKAASRKKSA